jgi:hypothetical protein
VTNGGSGNVTRPIIEFSARGWAYLRVPQGLLVFLPDEWKRALRRGRLQRVAQIIRPKKWIARRDLLSATRYPARELDDLCETLVGMGKIRSEPGKKGGGGWQWIST